ncbi:MAG: DNA polymerase III subunit delta [Bacteroidales bacterium]|nr:DNA polymerase III subunit delta [Bacteroidales bacterium]
MAKGEPDAAIQARDIIEDVRNGIFKPVYLLMGEEPFYPDMVCDEIISCAVEDNARDFDQFIFYGTDSDAEKVISAARGYSMLGGRVLVVLKEAQVWKESELEKLAFYCERPMDSTVLVVCLHADRVDGRKSFYKSAKKIGTVLDSPAVRDYEIASWIEDYYSGKGLRIDPSAAALLGEYAGTDLCTIAVETDKLLKNLPEGVAAVSVADIERNVGISRQYSIFELTKALSYRDTGTSLKVAAHLGNVARFSAPYAITMLFTHFYRMLKYEAAVAGGKQITQEEKSRILGVKPYFFREYDVAVRNYPLKSLMSIMSLLRDYDFKAKGGDIGPDTTDSEILTELVTKILNV